MEMKICTYCRRSKSVEDFNVRKYKNGKFGRRSYCKKCGNVAAIRWRKNHPELANLWGRDARYKRTYGISEQEYNKLLNEQNHKCAICLLPCSNFKSRLAVDHNHTTSKIRGLLCVSCNTGIGNLKNIQNLKNAIKYFEQNEG